VGLFTCIGFTVGQSDNLARASEEAPALLPESYKESVPYRRCPSRRSIRFWVDGWVLKRLMSPPPENGCMISM